MELLSPPRGLIGVQDISSSLMVSAGGHGSGHHDTRKRVELSREGLNEYSIQIIGSPFSD